MRNNKRTCHLDMSGMISPEVIFTWHGNISRWLPVVCSEYFMKPLECHKEACSPIIQLCRALILDDL